MQKAVVMIQNLAIKNFKSIKDLSISCKKLNVFIGEPNSGKSNIIEAFTLQSGILSTIGLNRQIFRYKTVSDLFYDFNTSKSIEVNTDQKHLNLNFSVKADGHFDDQFHLTIGGERKKIVDISHNGTIANQNVLHDSNVLFYEFRRLEQFPKSVHPNLSPPFGDNLASILLTNGDFKKWVTEFLKSKQFKLTFKPNENEILFSKIVDDEIYSFPFFMLSETLQRIIFYTLAIKSNKDGIILFDEPDTNTFPLYTKELAERIALDETNQFFLTTHNPYLLLSLIEKSKEKDINVFITQMKDFQTVVNKLTTEQISEVLDLNSDVFFNFDNILSL